MRAILLLSVVFGLSCSVTAKRDMLNQRVLDHELGQYILETMDVVRSPISPIQRQFTSQMLVRVANDFFTTQEEKVNWITLLAIESQFVQNAKSSVGAVGLGQIMPQWFVSHGAQCGIKGLKADDINDPAINATVSACIFRTLLDKVPNKSVTLALVAYNSGLHSTSSKNILSFGPLNNETANYVSRFTYVKELTGDSNRTGTRGTNKAK